MHPVLIGLTGAIGTGKSSVAAALADHGAEVVSGDELGKLALEGSPESLRLVRERFGDEVFSPQGALLRRELGARVFSSPGHVKWLTELTFPRIHELWLLAVEATTSEVIVLDAALIVEWGIEAEFDYLVVVTAPSHLTRERLVRSGRLSATEIASRQDMQFDPSAKAAFADWVIVNDGSPEALRRQVDKFWTEVVIRELASRRTQPNDC